jgi:hypothetical protein
MPRTVERLSPVVESTAPCFSAKALGETLQV